MSCMNFRVKLTQVQLIWCCGRISLGVDTASATMVLVMFPYENTARTGLNPLCIKTDPMTLLLLPWRRASPSHQFPWYWLCAVIGSSVRKLSTCRVHIDGLVQEKRNSIANALELRLSCAKPSISSYAYDLLLSPKVTCHVSRCVLTVPGIGLLPM